MAEQDNATRNIINKLLEQRIVLLSEPVMPDSAERLIAQLLYLDSQDPEKPILFYINTPGGSISDGFAIFDTVRFLRAPVKTICTGLSASMGTILMLSPPEKKHRFTLPNTRFMIHQPSSGYRGTASDIEIYVEETGKDAETIKHDMNRDFWMDAEQAVEYGLCHGIIRSMADLG